MRRSVYRSLQVVRRNQTMVPGDVQRDVTHDLAGFEPAGHVA